MDSSDLLAKVDILSSSASEQETDHNSPSVAINIQHFDLFNENGLNGFIEDLLKNHAPRKTKRTLFDWCLDKTDIMDVNSRSFIEQHSNAISKFRSKRQLIGFLKGKLGPMVAVPTRIVTNNTSEKWNNFIWFVLGVFSTILAVSLIGMISLNRGIELIEWQGLDREYIGYYKSIKSIIDSMNKNL